MSTFSRMKFPYCQKVLPLTYDDSLSYYEAICKMVDKVNELIAYIEGFESNVLEQSKQYTDNQIVTLKGVIDSEFNEYKQEVTATLNSYQKQIDDFGTKYDNQIADLYSKIVELNTAIGKLYAYLDTYRDNIDSRFEQMYKDLQEFIEESVSNVERLYVISPVTGKYQDIQTVLDDMYKALNWGAITAGEYDTLKLQAVIYDHKFITAREYDTSAKFALFNELYNRIISPFTGVMTYIGDIINQLANLHRNALTASEYDVKGLSADRYDSLGVSAYEYDWNGKTVIV